MIIIFITKIKLLALSQAAHEEIYIRRLLKELQVKLDDKKIIIQCNNQQTLRLIIAEIRRLNTKFKYINIHNH